MRIDRCKNAITEVANGELFIKAPEANIGVTESSNMSSCWIPDAAKTPMQKFIVSETLNVAGRIVQIGKPIQTPPKRPPIFVISDIGPDTFIFSVEDLIVFVGGDVLALIETIGTKAVPRDEPTSGT